MAANDATRAMSRASNESEDLELIRLISSEEDEFDVESSFVENPRPRRVETPVRPYLPFVPQNTGNRQRTSHCWTPSQLRARKAESEPSGMKPYPGVSYKVTCDFLGRPMMDIVEEGTPGRNTAFQPQQRRLSARSMRPTAARHDRRTEAASTQAQPSTVDTRSNLFQLVSAGIGNSNSMQAAAMTPVDSDPTSDTLLDTTEVKQNLTQMMEMPNDQFVALLQGETKDTITDLILDGIPTEMWERRVTPLQNCPASRSSEALPQARYGLQEEGEVEKEEEEEEEEEVEEEDEEEEWGEIEGDEYEDEGEEDYWGDNEGEEYEEEGEEEWEDVEENGMEDIEEEEEEEEWEDIDEEDEWEDIEEEESDEEGRTLIKGKGRSSRKGRRRNLRWGWGRNLRKGMGRNVSRASGRILSGEEGEGSEFEEGEDEWTDIEGEEFEEEGEEFGEGEGEEEEVSVEEDEEEEENEGCGCFPRFQKKKENKSQKKSKFQKICGFFRRIFGKK